jgi:hypothetical protein
LILAEHLKQSPPNSRYLSPQIQNELIELCGNQIRDNIIKATGYDYPHLPGLGNNDEKLGLPERLSTVQEPISLNDLNFCPTSKLKDWTPSFASILRFPNELHVLITYTVSSFQRLWPYFYTNKYRNITKMQNLYKCTEGVVAKLSQRRQSKQLQTMIWL